MIDYWVDGHCITADNMFEATAECRHLYNFTPMLVRPWNANDQAESERNDND